MKNKAIYFITFGCVGITTEIFFTAFYNLLTKYQADKILDLRLVGETYIWMFFIYGVGSLIFPILYRYIKNYKIAIRLLIYCIVIYFIEFTAGFMLDITTGSCPWEYNSRFAICGYIRLDYAMFWMVFGLLVEKLYLFLIGTFEN